MKNKEDKGSYVKDLLINLKFNTIYKCSFFSFISKKLTLN